MYNSCVIYGTVWPKGEQKMNNSKTVRKITGSAILLALIVIFQFIGNQINISGVSFNLSLLPIAIGAMVYGPLVGGFLGLATGAMVLPSAGVFLSYNVIGTILVCLLKTSVAGVVSGLLFKLIRKKSIFAAILISSMALPIINSGLFAIGCFTIFNGLMAYWAGSQEQVVGYVFISLIGINFLFELGASIVLTPSVAYILKAISRNNGISEDIKEAFNKDRQNEQI